MSRQSACHAGRGLTVGLQHRRKKPGGHGSLLTVVPAFRRQGQDPGASCLARLAQLVSSASVSDPASENKVESDQQDIQCQLPISSYTCTAYIPHPHVNTYPHMQACTHITHIYMHTNSDSLKRALE